METIRIKNLESATIKMFHSKNFEYKNLDKYDKRNDLIMTFVFDGLMARRFDYVSLQDQKAIRIYTRSIKEPEAVQMTSGVYFGDTEVLNYDRQYKNAAELIKDGYTSGVYSIGYLMEV